MTDKCKVDFPDCIQRTRIGSIKRIFCKVCGYIIAEHRGRSFWRSRMYAEVKIRFADKSAHVTHLCKACVPKVRGDQEVLMELYEADIRDMMVDDPKMAVYLDGKENPKIVATDYQARGLK